MNVIDGTSMREIARSFNMDHPSTVMRQIQFMEELTEEYPKIMKFWSEQWIAGKVPRTIEGMQEYLVRVCERDALDTTCISTSGKTYNMIPAAKRRKTWPGPLDLTAAEAKKTASRQRKVLEQVSGDPLDRMLESERHRQWTSTYSEKFRKMPPELSELSWELRMAWIEIHHKNDLEMAKRFASLKDLIGEELFTALYLFCYIDMGKEAIEKEMNWPARSAKAIFAINIPIVHKLLLERLT